MTLYELNEEQLNELKQALLCDIYEAMEWGSPSWGELGDADRIISAGLLVAAYDNTVFSNDDFCCSFGK